MVIFEKERQVVDGFDAAPPEPIVHVTAQPNDADTPLNFEFGTQEPSYVEEVTRAEIIEPIIEESAP